MVRQDVPLKNKLMDLYKRFSHGLMDVQYPGAQLPLQFSPEGRIHMMAGHWAESCRGKKINENETMVLR